MGNGGYWILLFDGWGAGLVMVNPRLHVEGVDLDGYPRNWWPGEDGDDEDAVLARHGLTGREFVRVVWGSDGR